MVVVRIFFDGDFHAWLERFILETARLKEIFRVITTLQACQTKIEFLPQVSSQLVALSGREFLEVTG